MAGREVICPNPNCGLRGVLRRRSKGSVSAILSWMAAGLLPGIWLLGCFGFPVGILPAAIYMILFNGNDRI
jgi:hypothetical protein